MKKYYLLGLSATILLILILFVVVYIMSTIDGGKQCSNFASNYDCGFFKFVFNSIALGIAFGWFIVIPLFISAVLINTFILRSIDKYVTSHTSIGVSNGFKYVMLLIMGIAITFFLVFFLEEIYQRLDIILYCIIGYMCAFGIRKLIGRWNGSKATCNIEKKGVTQRIVLAILLTGITLYFTQYGDLFEFGIQVLMIVPGFLLYESRHRWCILKSFGKKPLVGGDSIQDAITENPGN